MKKKSSKGRMGGFRAEERDKIRKILRKVDKLTNREKKSDKRI